MLLAADAERKKGSIGLLLANLQARIVVDEDGKVDAADGEPGELWIKGHTVMKVVWPEKTYLCSQLI
jgi:acyl-CoA synthetase (AMP-forming)/AMP-acid ligase II